jgi:hypothetical protein
VSATEGKRYRAGEPTDDLCRACKTTRAHTVMAVDGQGQIVRVVCDFCGSQHNYRGGGERRSPAVAPLGSPALPAAREPFPQISERERKRPRMTTSDAGDDLEGMLRRVLRQELGLTPVVPADKWRGGELVLRPGKAGLQDKTWPIESFFHKIVMIRNRLRTLEQQVNSSELPDDAKVRLQSYVTACYGSLTSFNVLFANEEDQFKGAGSGD